MKTFIYPNPPVSIDTAGLATEAKQDLQIVEAALTNTKLDSLIAQSDLDTKEVSSLLDTSGTNIPASSGNPLQIIASTSAQTYKIQSVEDIGEYIGLYTGAALSETLVAALPLGGGEIAVNIAAGTRISLRALENTAISSGKIILNLLG